MFVTSIRSSARYQFFWHGHGQKVPRQRQLIHLGEIRDVIDQRLGLRRRHDDGKDEGVKRARDFIGAWCESRQGIPGRSGLGIRLLARDRLGHDEEEGEGVADLGAGPVCRREEEGRPARVRARAFLGHALGRGEGETGGAPLGQSLAARGACWPKGRGKKRRRGGWSRPSARIEREVFPLFFVCFLFVPFYFKVFSKQF